MDLQVKFRELISLSGILITIHLDSSFTDNCLNSKKDYMIHHAQTAKESANGYRFPRMNGFRKLEQTYS